MKIQENLAEYKLKLPTAVKLLAVSKTKPTSSILEAYKSGHRLFGENKARELEEKAKELPEDIEWHFIGHLQTNKVKYIAPYVSLIHSVDSIKLLKEINKRAEQNNRIISVLLQVHIASEEHKFGLSVEELNQVLGELKNEPLPNVKVVGLMGMASFTDNSNQVEEEFEKLHALFERLKKDNTSISELSMGMSNDYELAVKHGSTMVRIGSAIFGSRT